MEDLWPLFAETLEGSISPAFIGWPLELDELEGQLDDLPAPAR